MSQETRKVLDMLMQDKINVEEAESLLEHLHTPNDAKTETLPVSVRNLSRLRILVEDGEAEKVDIQVPLKLVKLGMSFSNFLPQEAKEALNEKGIDLSELPQMDEGEFLDAIAGLRVDVRDEDSSVKIFCE